MGYFAILIIFSVVAIIFAKKWYSWIIYAIGVVVTYISISGNQKKYDMLGLPNATKSLWTTFFIISIIGAAIILFRFLKATGFKLPKKEKNYYGKLNAANQTQSYTCEKCGIHLREDQTRFRDGKAYCNSCYNLIKK